MVVNERTSINVVDRWSGSAQDPASQQHACTDTNTQTHICKHWHKHTNTHARFDKHTNTHTHTHAFTKTHTHTQLCTHTHTHTHTHRWGCVIVYKKPAGTGFNIFGLEIQTHQFLCCFFSPRMNRLTHRHTDRNILTCTGYHSFITLTVWKSVYLSIFQFICLFNWLSVCIFNIW